ncbi:MAG TPA: hypothetical protein VGE13_00930 [Candidatus Saccharimonadales bacterium]
MGKTKKKRNKVYRGADAKQAVPQVVKVEAVDRSKPRQWWHEKKRIAKPIMIATLVVLVIVWLLSELLRAIFF